ncbi:MAG: dihydrofolate reductase family protein [Candidatus Limnocylindrales bacterium]
MPAGLRDRYGGELTIPLHPDRPTIVANFVETLDGVVALDRSGGAGGGEISGFFEPDRFVMALLRALADVVLVGAGTVRAAPDHRWSADHVHPGSASVTAAWRRALGLEPQPTTVVVTGAGNLDPHHPGLSATAVPVVVATTAAGAARLAGSGLPPAVRVEVLGEAGHVAAGPLLGLLVRLGARLVLCEGGPHLFAGLLAAGLGDELFLTLAPQLLGRSGTVGRLALVEGHAFAASVAPWATLHSARRAGDHLFLRYRPASPML